MFNFVVILIGCYFSYSIRNVDKKYKEVYFLLIYYIIIYI